MVGDNDNDDGDAEMGYNHHSYESLEKYPGNKTPTSIRSIASSGSARIMREEEVRRSLNAIKTGYTNQSYENTGDVQPGSAQQTQSLYPNLNTTVAGAQGIGVEPTPPQPVSVISVGPDMATPPHYAGQDPQSEPAAVSQITVGVDTDTVSDPTVGGEPEHVSSIAVTGISPPTSSTTTPEQSRRVPPADHTTESARMWSSTTTLQYARLNSHTM